MLRILDEIPSDSFARELLLDEAFGADRIAKTCERLREFREPAHGLALVAKHAGQLVGTLRFWNIDAGGCPALLLGPIAVSEQNRGLGLGGEMIRRGLTLAGALGHNAVILVGDAPYYCRFGFERRLAANLDLPGPYDRSRFLALELQTGALAGVSGLVCATGRRMPGAGNCSIFPADRTADSEGDRA